MKTIHTGYCDKFELARASQPTIFNRPFWHGDGSPAVPVKIVISEPNAKRVLALRRKLK